MPDACAAAPAKKPQPVTLITARDDTIRYLQDPLNRRVLQARLSYGEGVYAAYAQTVRAACPSLPQAYELDVVDMVRRALTAQPRRQVKRVPGRAA
jgi:hypothetical protein